MKKFLVVGLCVGLAITAHVVDGKTYTSVGAANKVYQTPHEKKKLFASVGCDYFNDIQIVVPGGLMAPRDTDYYKTNATATDILSADYSKAAKARALAPMYLKYISDVVGYGVFAAKDISKGDFIGVYGGVLRPEGVGAHGNPEDVDYAWYYTVDSPSGGKLIVDGKYEGNELRFINHAQRPNTHRIDVIVDNMFLVCYVATQDIKKDEQLTVHYGDGYWTARKIDPTVFA